MNGAEYDLEQIVREVLRRLRELETTGQIQTTAAGQIEPCTTLTLCERVITLETLRNKLAATKRVVVPRGTVVTPAVRDELKTRQIKLEFAANTRMKTQPTRVMHLAVATQYNPAALVKRMSAVGTRIEHFIATNWKEALDKMTQELTSTPAAGVILTDRPALVACHANRNSALRAAVACDARSAKDAVESLDANLLVVDPAAHSLYVLENLLKEYGRAEHREMPA